VLLPPSGPERLSIEVKAIVNNAAALKLAVTPAALGGARLSMPAALRRSMVSRDAKRTLSDELSS
jgi:hypothetical protein